MVAKLGDLNDRFEEVSASLSDAETMADREKFTALSKEFAEIEPVVLCYQKVTVLKDSLEENSLLLDDEDPDLRELAEQNMRQKTKCRFYLHNYKRCCCPGTLTISPTRF